jgi:hypothetical protein
LRKSGGQNGDKQGLHGVHDNHSPMDHPATTVLAPLRALTAAGAAPPWSAAEHP